MPSAIFRCDASAVIGTGHVVRCTALAQEMAARGWNCRMVALPGTRAAVAAFLPAAIEMTESELADDPKALAGLLSQPCDLLVIDSYRLGVEYERALGKFTSQRLVIDDLPNRAHDTELLLDQTLARTAGDYVGMVGAETRLLLGPGYALLRPEFAASRRQAIDRRRRAGPVKAILVSLGGAASGDLLGLILDGVKSADLPFDVHVVGASVQGGGKTAPARLVQHHRTSDIHRLMSECDIAIGAGGGSAWERCCLGLPSLIVQIADNQKDVAASLAHAGAAIDLGPLSRLDVATIGQTLRALAGDAVRRATMASAAAQVCDGLGVRRVCGELAPRLSGAKRPVTLRPVNGDDTRLLFEWQQLPQVRRYANDPRPPAWEAHRAWFQRRIGNPSAGPFSIVMHDRRPVGVLRFDAPIPERFDVTAHPGREAFLVSILLEPQSYGVGIASAALAAGRDLLPGALFYAEVLEGNEASHRLFSRAGYRRLRPDLYVSEP